MLNSISGNILTRHQTCSDGKSWPRHQVRPFSSLFCLDSCLGSEAAPSRSCRLPSRDLPFRLRTLWQAHTPPGLPTLPQQTHFAQGATPRAASDLLPSFSSLEAAWELPLERQFRAGWGMATRCDGVQKEERPVSGPRPRQARRGCAHTATALRGTSYRDKQPATSIGQVLLWSSASAASLGPLLPKRLLPRLLPSCLGFCDGAPVPTAGHAVSWDGVLRHTWRVNP